MERTLAVLVIESTSTKSVNIVDIAENQQVYFLHIQPQDVPIVIEDIKPDLLLVDKQVHSVCTHLCTQPSLSDIPILLCRTPLNLDILRVILATLASERG